MLLTAGGGVVTRGGGVARVVPVFTAVTDADAIWWEWTGDAVTFWRIKWGTASGVYTESYDVNDANARACMFSDFLTESGNYFVIVVACDAGGEGDAADEVAVAYTA